jgi:hypothetical protein
VGKVETIQTTIAQATALALTPQQMVAICDLAAAQLMCGKAVASHTIGATTFEFQDIKSIREVREYYQSQVINQTPMACLAAEF